LIHPVHKGEAKRASLFSDTKTAERRMQTEGNGTARDCGRLCRMNVLFRKPGRMGKLSGRRAAMERFRKQEALVKKEQGDFI